MEDCLFCKIAEKKINSEIVYENDHVIAFKDIHPIAPVHVLVIPKKHITSLNEVDVSNMKCIDECMLAIKEVAKICGVYDDGYRVVSNIGKNGGQVVKHLHFHVIGGKKL